MFHKRRIVVEDEDQDVMVTDKQLGVLYGMEFLYLVTPSRPMVIGKITKEWSCIINASVTLAVET